MAPKQKSADAARSERITSTELNDNDVLFGRGLGPSQYMGNIKCVLFAMQERRSILLSILTV